MQLSSATLHFADQQNRMLSNELVVSLPLDTEDIVLPAEAYPSHKKDEAEDEGGMKKTLLPADENLDDVYKEVLKIQPGSPHEGINPLLLSELYITGIQCGRLS